MHFHVAQHPRLGIGELDVLRDVLKRERWQHIVILRLLLIAFQLSSFLEYEFSLCGRKCAFKSLKVCFVCCLLSVGFAAIWRVEKLEEVLVLREMPLDEALEEATLCEVLPYPIRELIDLEETERVATVKRVRHHVGDIHQPTVRFRPLGTKLNLMQCLLEQVGVNTVLFHILQRLEQHLFDLLEVVSLYALHAHREGGLPCRVIEAGTWAELGRDLALDDGLVEWSVWPGE